MIVGTSVELSGLWTNTVISTKLLLINIKWINLSGKVDCRDELAFNPS